MTIDQVSLTLGELRGELKQISAQVRAGNEGRKELHVKISDMAENLIGVRAEVTALGDTTKAMSELVQSHEVLRQQGSGMRTLLAGAVSACGTMGVFELARHLLSRL